MYKRILSLALATSMTLSTFMPAFGATIDFGSEIDFTQEESQEDFFIEQNEEIDMTGDALGYESMWEENINNIDIKNKTCRSILDY